MPQSLPVVEFLEKARHTPVIDVRSPAEFLQAHVPGAFNVPLFSNEERAQVGTCYKQVGRDEAVLLGLELVGPKLADFVRATRSIAPKKEVLVHCWRGGMRSGSFAWLLETAGFSVSTLQGGYKSYRNHLVPSFSVPQNIIILGGKTGSGKTDILKELKNLGEQVIDLEGIAHHKGSSFGAIGQAPQPSSEQFENELYTYFKDLDPTLPLWLEDESRNVGTCSIPPALWVQMRRSPVAFVEMPKSERIARLVREYACHDPNLLFQATDRIKKRLGGQHHQAAIEALNVGDYAQVADITLVYYDKAYLHGLSERDAEKVHLIEVQSDSPKETAVKLIAWRKTLVEDRGLFASDAAALSP